MDSANQVDQRPEPRWPVLAVPEHALDDRPLLDVHRIDGYLIARFGRVCDPANAVFERVTLGHERRLEQQIGLDAQVVVAQGLDRPLPLAGGEALVAVELEHLVIVCLQADGHSAAGVSLGNPGHLVWRAHLGAGLDDQVKSPLMGLGEDGLLPVEWILAVLEEGSRSVDLHHRTAFEIVRLLLRILPLGVQVGAGHVVAHVVEISAEGAA